MASTPISGSVNINFGPTPRTSGVFTIAMQPNTRIIMLSQAAGPYPGKGTLADEAEMDSVQVMTTVVGRNVTCHWRSSGAVVGSFRFNWIAV